MNRRGQALIEFVLILPVLILILFTIVDFGNIFYSKYDLQNQSADIVSLVRSGNDEQEILDIYSKVDVQINNYKNDYKKITLIKEVKLITPFMNEIFGNPYLIEVERIVPND